jgi:DNA recombination protein Rad52
MSTGGFTDRQLKKLATPLDRARVQTRESGGKTLSYIEGWFAISEANRIFGYDGWDREMVAFERVFERSRSDGTLCAYFARVRVRVRANSTTILREGTGFGQATAGHAGEAHERAMKAAETDATKRALATFGGRFGLSLYDKDRSDGAASANDGALRRSNSIEIPIAQSKDWPVRERYRLVASDGSVCEVGSAESFCSGFRQLLDATRHHEEVETLRVNNAAMIATLRARSNLRTLRGEHYVDVLQRLIAARAKTLAPLVSVTSPPKGDQAQSENSAPSHLSNSDPTLETPSEALSEPSKTDQRRGHGRTNAYGPFVPAPLYPLGSIAERIQRSVSGRQDPVKGSRDIAPVVVDTPAVTKEMVEARPAIAQRIASALLPTRRSHIGGGYSIDKSVFALPSERRLRSKAHLSFVAAWPCLVCEALPCHAHHVTFAQPRGLSLKVSDEFTVPLCVVHHNALHAAGNESSWWRVQGIDPLEHARAFWLATNSETDGATAKLDPNGDTPSVGSASET